MTSSQINRVEKSRRKDTHTSQETRRNEMKRARRKKESRENTLIIEMSLRGRPELTSSRFAWIFNRKFLPKNEIRKLWQDGDAWPPFTVAGYAFKEKLLPNDGGEANHARWCLMMMMMEHSHSNCINYGVDSLYQDICLFIGSPRPFIKPVEHFN